MIVMDYSRTRRARMDSVRLFLLPLLLITTAMATAAPARLTLNLYSGHADAAGDTVRWRSATLAVDRIFPLQHPQWRVAAAVGVLESEQASGLADSWLSLTRLGQRRHLQHWWDIQTRLKLPTADATAGLGTGGLDSELRIRALSAWGRVVPWYYLGYRLRGSSDYYDVRNGFGWAAGFNLDHWYASYSGQESSVRHGACQQMISLGRSADFQGQSVSPYLSWSLAARTGWGAGISIRF